MKNEIKNKCTIGLVIMASGMSKRFGKNKLMADWKGYPLIQRILDLTKGDLFARRVVVTRSEEVKKLCEEQQIDVIFHELPNRNDTVRLGVEKMKDLDGCMFCPCDQPMLTFASIEGIVKRFQSARSGIFRLSDQEKEGMPAIFGREYYEELLSLPEKSGGSFVIRNHRSEVQLVPVLYELELYDVDTQEDYEYLLNLIKEE